MDKKINFIPQGQIFMGNRKVSFEVNPLDINLAKIQMNLSERCEREVPENGDFATILERFKSLDPTIDLSEIIISCKYDKNNPGIKNVNRILSAKIFKQNGQIKDVQLFNGTKKELLEYLNTYEFFEICKLSCLE
ncbi:MAG: hypothetical protein IKU37_03660 [Candidatus Gastranaerophilales bacterium]|nr:hypothetical protein [Candidatus Gastranaerophilales bacterium]